MFAALGFAWYSFCTWTLFRANSKQGHWSLTWPAQLSGIAIVVTFLVVVISDDPFGVLLLGAVLFLPPIAVLLASVPILGLLALPLFVSITVLLAFWAQTRRFSPLIAFGLTLIITPFTADWYWDRAMCSSARALGLTDIQRPSFRHNLGRVGDKGGREPYAIALKDGEIWDWGYSSERFVRYGGELPSGADMDKFRPLKCP